MNKRKELLLMMSLMVVFALLFLASFLSLNRGAALFGLGLSYAIEDYLIMILCTLSVMQLLWHIIKH